MSVETIRSDAGSPAKRRVGGQQLVAVSFLLFAAVLLATGALIFWNVTHPPRAVCTLPRIELPGSPDSMAWSPDGQELVVGVNDGPVNPRQRRSLQRWKLYRVRFPERTVTPLPPVAVTSGLGILRTGDRPLVMSTYYVPGTGPFGKSRCELYCLEDWGPGWQHREVACDQVILSPDFQRAAALYTRRTTQQVPFKTTRGTRIVNEFRTVAERLEVIRLPSMKVERTFPLHLPAAFTVTPVWRGARTLHLLAQAGRTESGVEYHVGENSLRNAAPLSPSELPYTSYDPPFRYFGVSEKRPPLDASIRGRPAPGDGARTWLHQNGIPGVPDVPPQLYLIVRQWAGPTIREEPYGEDGRGQQGHWSYSSAPVVSPDGKRIALRAPDNTLRVLELSGGSR